MEDGSELEIHELRIARCSLERTFTVGIILSGLMNFTNCSNSLKLLCSLYGTPGKINDLLNAAKRKEKGQ